MILYICPACGSEMTLATTFKSSPIHFLHCKVCNCSVDEIDGDIWVNPILRGSCKV